MLLCCVCSTLCHSPLPLSLNRVSQSCMTPRLGVFCPCHRRTVADVYCHIPALWRAREHQLRPQVWQVPCSLSHFSSPEASVFVSAFLFFFLISNNFWGQGLTLQSSGLKLKGPPVYLLRNDTTPC